ncbi:hypothetical protein QF026_002040 [Streptomyces aurantiacus]|nr:hypothetical protein [Streptomyces aurantiacus]
MGRYGYCPRPALNMEHVIQNTWRVRNCTRARNDTPPRRLRLRLRGISGGGCGCGRALALSCAYDPGVVLIHLCRDTPLSADEAWRRLTVWERHADVVPLTRIQVVTEPPRGAGTVFVARTGVGPVAFDDRMEVVVWQAPRDGAPGLCRLVKRGRVVLGWAEIEVRPAAGDGSQVVWREEAGVRGLPRAFDPLLGRATRWMFGRVVDRLLSRP